MFLLGCLILGTFISADGRRTIQAHVGQRADLQCVTPPTVLSNWHRLYVQRPVKGASPLVVFAFSEGREEPWYQDGRFRNRTRLYLQNLTLSLSDVSPEDEGQYECKIFTPTKSGSQLTYEGHLTLYVWANYQQPQISLARNGSGEDAALTCSAQGGYPMGYIEWKLPPTVADVGNISEIWAERHPHTQLYKVSGRLNTSSSLEGSASCCVVTSEAELCSDSVELTAPSGGRGQREGVPVCMILLLSVLVWGR
ncbi:T-lymphocyte activation antigen CD80 [Lithobates pipiens]